MKKQLLTLLCALVLALGCTATGFAAPQSNNLVGYVDTQRVMQSYPDIQIIISAIDAEHQKAQQEFDRQAASLDDQGKQALSENLVQEVAKREQELMSPVRRNIQKAIEKAAKAQGISSVVDASVMLSGGKDLTNDVITEIQK